MTLPPSDLDTQALAALAGALHPTSPRPDGLFSRESPSWQRLLAAARQHRVAGLISVALTRAGRLESLPETVRLQLRRDVLAAQRECAIQRRALAAAAAVLSAAGIPVIALKGAALQLTVYEQPGLRPMSDVDLLVAPDRLDDAVEALERGGFIKPSDADVAFWKSAYYNLPLSAPGEPPAVIEIHWSIAQEDRHRPDVAGLFRRRQVVRLDIPERGEIGVLSPCDLLLHQALHHSYHFFEPRLIWIHDLALLQARPVDVDELIARATAWGVRVPLSLSLIQIERTFPGLVGPRLASWARGFKRARWLIARFGRPDGALLFDRWWLRRRQLLLGLAMLDGPVQAIRALAGWAARARRHGDAAGLRRPAPHAGTGSERL